MKTKNITLILILSFFISSSQPCFSMDYIRDSYNTTLSMITTNIAKAHDWTNNFYMGCKEIGVLATVSASFGMYNFKKITGLDESKLDTYNSDQLKQAMNRIQKMISYKGWSQQLNDMLDKVQNQYQQKLSDEEFTAEEEKIKREAELSNDKETLRAIQKEISRAKKQP